MTNIGLQAISTAVERFTASAVFILTLVAGTIGYLIATICANPTIP
jgi:hypothetical protein